MPDPIFDAGDIKDSVKNRNDGDLEAKSRLSYDYAHLTPAQFKQVVKDMSNNPADKVTTFKLDTNGNVTQVIDTLHDMVIFDSSSPNGACGATAAGLFRGETNTCEYTGHYGDGPTKNPPKVNN